MEVPQELHNRYLERRKKDLENCINSLKDENFNEIERVGHQLKGNAITFGHDELTEIGSKMERAAATANANELEEAIQNFSTWLKNHLN
jgi:HPt (histidine-containing phosphotransfer) domain-containing protein